MNASPPPIRVVACGALTAFGDEDETLRALLDGRRALQMSPVLGGDGGDEVPLALCPGRSLDETQPPNWLSFIHRLADRIPGAGWGEARRPIFVTSSNFGVGSLHAYRRDGDPGHLAFGTPFRCVNELRRELDWGPDITTLSHACVSAHLGLMQAAQVLAAGLADEVLVFSFDFLSPFVAGGFHSLKILNNAFPAPYHAGDTGSIGLGDGAAFAILARDRGEFIISEQNLYNEMHHFTANRVDGAGFSACLAPLRQPAAGRRLWLKGHGTGTLEAGRLESETLARHFPEAPLVSWKGSLGHTLGSCGLVELALAIAAIRGGQIPGTVGGRDPSFTDCVQLDSFSSADFDAVLCASNAFGGAHAAFLLSHA